jgi:molybdenum cofactor cytidylyltransferase
VFNPTYADGEMRSSLQIGLQALWNSSDACMIVLGDQPEIQQDVMRSVLTIYHEGKGRIIAPSYDRQRGHPVLIDHAFWSEIMELEPGQAPRDFIRAHEDEIYHLVVDTETVLSDIDTPDDYRRAVGQ